MSDMGGSPRAVTDHEMEIVVISGASGLIGRALASRLEAAGRGVLRIVRRTALPGEVAWNPASESIDRDAMEGADAVVHLAGESIGEGRWTRAKKDRIRSSRVEGTRTLCDGLARMKKRPSVLVAASAIGWYGNGGDAESDEGSPRGEGYLPEVCAAWEAATRSASEAGIRVVNLRIGVVLARDGGALAKMLPPFRLGLGGPIGGGAQFVSWISLPDLMSALEWCLRDASLRGPVNATAPGAVRQGDFARALGRALRRPAFVPLPAWAVRLALGDKGEALLLDGAKVVPRRLLEAGFSFSHSEIDAALSALLSLRR